MRRLLQRFVQATNSTFYRAMATLAILILGALAWYGLHRDITAHANPCAEASTNQTCVTYVCNIGSILGVKPSQTCRPLVKEHKP